MGNQKGNKKTVTKRTVNDVNEKRLEFANVTDVPLRVNMCETLDCMKFTEQGERGI